MGLIDIILLEPILRQELEAQATGPDVKILFRFLFTGALSLAPEPRKFIADSRRSEIAIANLFLIRPALTINQRYFTADDLDIIHTQLGK